MAVKAKEESSVFISHAVKDRDIVIQFADFLRLACDISEKAIFCTSLGGIPNGEFFVRTILEQMEKSHAAICILTPDYFASHFCLAEIGAAQLRMHAQGRGRTFTLTVPPLDYDGLKGVLFGVQSGRINDPDALEDLRTFIKQTLDTETSGRTWTRAKGDFLKKISGLVHQREMHLLAQQKLRVLKADLERLTDEQIKKLKVVFTRKFRAIFRNETGRVIKVKSAELECGPTDAQPDPRPWYVVQTRAGRGEWPVLAGWACCAR
jgi:TIR domain